MISAILSEFNLNVPMYNAQYCVRPLAATTQIGILGLVGTYIALGRAPELLHIAYSTNAISQAEVTGLCQLLRHSPCLAHRAFLDCKRGNTLNTLNRPRVIIFR